MALNSHVVGPWYLVIVSSVRSTLLTRWAHERVAKSRRPRREVFLGVMSVVDSGHDSAIHSYATFNMGHASAASG